MRFITQSAGAAFIAAGIYEAVEMTALYVGLSLSMLGFTIMLAAPATRSVKGEAQSKD